MTSFAPRSTELKPRRISYKPPPPKKRNLIKGINTWVVLLVRYSGPFLKWPREELRQMCQRTRKLIRLYIWEMTYVSKWKKGERGRGLISTEDSVDASIQEHEGYIKMGKERLIIVTGSSSYNIMIKRKKQSNRNGKKNSCMDISSDKLMKSYTRRSGHR